jgi:hypothetical protein
MVRTHCDIPAGRFGFARHPCGSAVIRLSVKIPVWVFLFFKFADSIRLSDN